MAALKYITQGGHWPQIILQGNINDNETNGLVIDAPGQVVSIGMLSPSVCNVPLIVRNVGKLLIDRYMPHTFWADTANINASQIYVNHWTPRNILKQRRSYNDLHHDLIFQALALLPGNQKKNGSRIDPNGVIEHVHINNVDMESELQHCNGIMLSEANTYRHFHIGTQSLNVKIEGNYWLNGNTLQDSVIGGGVSDIGSISGKYKPSMFIKARKKTNAVTDRCLALGVQHAERGDYPARGVIVI